MMGSFFKKDFSPFKQLSIVLVAMVVFHLVYWFYHKGEVDVDVLSEHYTITCAFLLLFALFNAILLLTANNDNAYWGKSLMAYLILLIVGLAFSYLLSGIAITDLGHIRFILMVFTFAYILILTIARTIKYIALVADKEHEKNSKGL